MRTIDYSEVLRGSAGLAGMKWPDDIGTAELALFRTSHDGRLQVAWESEAWPDICLLEKRYFRPMWSGSVVYPLGVERFDILSGRYFQNLRVGNFNAPPTIDGAVSAAWWAPCQAQYSGADYAVGKSYVIGDVVRYPVDGEYYQAVQNHVGGTPPFGPDTFGHLTPFVRRIDVAQVEDGIVAGEGEAHTVVGEFLRATDRDPRVTTKTAQLPFVVDDQGAVFVAPQKAVTFVWLKFRPRRPELNGDAWDVTKAYGGGQQVYYLNAAQTVANFYTANQAAAAGESPESAPDKWDLVELPYIFGGYLIEGGFADWLVSDGQEEKAQAHELRAMTALDLEADKLFRQQQQNRRLTMVR